MNKKTEVAVFGLLTAGALIALVIAAINKSMFSSDPMRLSRLSDIREEAYKRILIVAQSTSEDSVRTSEDCLLSITGRLEQGWPHFVIDEYRPSGFSEVDLLGNIYARIAFLSNQVGVDKRSRLLTLLYRIKPSEHKASEVWSAVVQTYGVSFAECHRNK